MMVVARLIVKHPIAFVTHYSIAFENTAETSTLVTHGCAYMIGGIAVTFMTSFTKITTPQKPWKFGDDIEMFIVVI